MAQQPRSSPVIPSDRAAFDSSGVVGLKRPDLRSRSRRSGLLSPTSTRLQVRTFRLWYYFVFAPRLAAVWPNMIFLASSLMVGWLLISAARA